MTETKTCRICHLDKQLSEFPPRKRKTGYTYYPYCRPCWNARANAKGKAARAANTASAQLARERAREWRAANPEKMSEACRSWRNRHPGWMGKYRRKEGAKRKTAARYAVFRALEVGTLQKPDHCEYCGVAASGRRLQAHHRDYDKPLDVRWLCTVCHGALHAPDRIGIKQERRRSA